MKHDAFKCPTCGDIIFSIAHHDFHYCTCGRCFVDGGFSYFRGGWSGDHPEKIQIEIPDLSEQEYYRIWAKSKIDEPYGLWTPEMQIPDSMQTMVDEAQSLKLGYED